MSRQQLSALLLALVLLGPACASDDDTPNTSDAGAVEQPGNANGEQPSGDEPDDADADAADAGDADAEDAEMDDTETTTVDQFDFSGGPPPSTQLILGGPNGTATVSVQCTGEGTGVVNFEIEGVDADAVVQVQLGAQTGDILVDTEGNGSADLEGDVPQPAAVAVLIDESVQRGQLEGC
jgi:hypothetical protein